MTTTHTLAQLAAAVEDGLVWAISLSEAVNSGVCGGYNADREITTAHEAFAEYRQRCEVLEAFVRHLASYQPIDDQWEDFTRGMIEARKQVAAEARALLPVNKNAPLPTRDE